MDYQPKAHNDLGNLPIQTQELFLSLSPPFPQHKGENSFWCKRMNQHFFVGDKHVKNLC